jgi:3-oxoacyl-[acyl-carrier protein] reductase
MPTKNILITGASRGIGKACALTFAKANYQVFLNCNKSLEEIESVQSEILSDNGSCHILVGDVSNPNKVKQLFSQIENICGGVDVLINNAGISYIGLLSQMTENDWNQVISTNLSSAFYCSKSAIPYMIQQKKGKIINISSIWGNIGASCEVAYSTSKAGLNGFTKALAKELAPSNIQVNAISCGVIDTQMNHGFSKEELDALIKDIPASRFGQASEVANLAFDLANNHPYLTGQIIGLDGGF